MDRTSATWKYVVAAGEALFVTVLWASSWVIIKFGLKEIPPLLFSGLRYEIAAIALLGVIGARSEYRKATMGLGRNRMGTLAIYGFVFVTLTQGAQFVALSLLEAITISMLLNLTPILVLVLGSIILREVPTYGQLGWILLGVAGVLLYFYPMDIPEVQWIGIIVALVGLVANSVSSIMGRAINKQRDVPPIVVTGMSMLVGGTVLLLAGLIYEGIVTLSIVSVIYILWLSLVNTALAFTLWNKAMQTLRAVDMSILNSTMLPQIVFLSVIFLGEKPTVIDLIGLVMIAVSALAVQIIQARRNGNHKGKTREEQT
jgi:drug/metabolite transporter (DMT)-like permease